MLSEEGAQSHWANYASCSCYGLPPAVQRTPPRGGSGMVPTGLSGPRSPRVRAAVPTIPGRDLWSCPPILGDSKKKSTLLPLRFYLSPIEMPYGFC